MSYKPPSTSESCKQEESLYERAARARKAREDAAERVARRYADIKPCKGKLRTGDEMDLQFDWPDTL